MVVKVNPAAIKAYSAAAAQINQQGNAINNSVFSSGGRDGGASFADLLANKAEDVFASARKVEELNLEAASGKQVDQLELITALNNTELDLQMVMAMREHILRIYQEISRMPI